MGVVKPIIFNMDGKDRPFLLDFNAWADLEDELGMDFFEIIGKFQEGKPSIKLMRAILWAGFKQCDPDITVRDVGAMLSVSNLQEAADAITKAVEQHMPEPSKDVDIPNPPTTPESHSPTSGSSE